MKQSNSPVQANCRSLFSECKRREHLVLNWDFHKYRDELVRKMVFGRPLIPSWAEIAARDASMRKGRSAPASQPTKDVSSLRSARQRKLSKANQPVSRYFLLVETLRQAKDKDKLWLFLALWLKQEAVREPEHFLPPETYQRLTLKSRQRFRGISFSDMKYSELVRCWMPYFERLLEDRNRNHSIAPSVHAELSALGYDSKAVELIMSRRWRSAVELSCEWLAAHKVIHTNRVDPDLARTLSNAHSRVNSAISKGSPTEPSAKKAK